MRHLLAGVLCRLVEAAETMEGGSAVSSELKHTRGPWEIAHYDSGLLEGLNFVRDKATKKVVCTLQTRIESETEANAQLISAAPELLEALKRLTEYGDIYRYRTNERSPYEQAMEALRKAEGRSE